MPLAPRAVLAAYLCALTLALAPAPGRAGDTEPANRLFVAAVKDWEAAMAMTAGDVATLQARLALLEDVAGAIESIIGDHPGADLAVRLIVGESVGPISRDGVANETARTHAAWTEACTGAPEVACVQELARRTLRGIGRERELALAALAREQARAGDVAAALALTREISSRVYRSAALASVVEARARAGAFPRARARAAEIETDFYQAEALAAIALAEAEAGRAESAAGGFEAAVTVARGVIPARQSHLLAAIAEMQAEAGLTGPALATAREIEDGGPRDRALGVIAAARARDGAFAAARATADGIAEGSERAQALGAIARELEAARRHDDALATVRDIEQPVGRAAGLAAVWEIQRLYSEEERAGATLAKAFAAARDAADPADRTRALIAIGRAQRLAGGEVMAMVTFAGAIATAGTVADAAGRATVLAETAGEITAARQHGWAGEVFESALAVGRGIADPRDRAMTLLRISGAQARAGAHAGARATAREIERPLLRDTAFHASATIAAEAGAPTEALLSAREISIAEAPLRVGAYAVIAREMAVARAR